MAALNMVIRASEPPPPSPGADRVKKIWFMYVVFRHDYTIKQYHRNLVLCDVGR